MEYVGMGGYKRNKIMGGMGGLVGSGGGGERDLGVRGDIVCEMLREFDIGGEDRKGVGEGMR
ncbi:hypothetical protein [Bacillus pumilus]|uniref:hypothetical protein n=1 Tax=Bacillus pumilus TaxID=1408 RepID=UPI00119F02B8|nr:hypothetical protein [Bacillus pumilus]